MGYRCPECNREFGDERQAFRAHALEAHRVDVRDQMECFLWNERLSFRRREATVESAFEDNGGAEQSKSPLAPLCQSGEIDTTENDCGAVRRPGEPHKLEQERSTRSPATNNEPEAG